MTRLSLTLAIVLAVTLTAAGQQGSAELEKLFARAEHMATVEGNLNGAIEEYRRVVDRAGSNRALAARALLRMAEAYQQMGDAEARRIYQRIVGEFPDRKEEVTLARARLGAGTAAPSAKRERALPVDSNMFLGTVSADGRFWSWSSRRDGDVFVRDLLTGADRLVYQAIPGEGGNFNVLSRDGTRVAFDRYDARDSEYRLYVASLRGQSGPEVRRILSMRVGRDIYAAAVRDWSPDGRSLVVTLNRVNSTVDVAIVSADDGSTRVIKRLPFGNLRTIFFSPDGRYVGYAVPIANTPQQNHIAVTAVDGSADRAVVEHPSQNYFMGWSPDGGAVIFGSDRNGSFGVWMQRLRDGRAQGDPVLLHDGGGFAAQSFGMSSAGALFMSKYTRNFVLRVAAIDLEAGKLVDDASADFREFVGGGGKPSWSPDGRSLAYVSGVQTTTIKIRNNENGYVRELPLRLAWLQAPADFGWADDGRSFLARGVSFDNQVGNWIIDAQTGETVPNRTEVGADAGNAELEWTGWASNNVTADGTKLYRPRDGGIVERDLRTGLERQVFTQRAPQNRIGVLHSSPDRRFSAFVENSGSGLTVFVMPYGGGQPRELFRMSGGFGRNGMTWTPDSRALLVMRREGQSQELWLVPVLDGSPRKLDIDVRNWQVTNISGGFKLRPDGRQIAFVTGEEKTETVALEHFLPPAGGR